MQLFYHESTHFCVTLLIAIFVFWKWRSWKLVIGVFAVGIFLDIDHLLDWFLANGSWRDIITSRYFLKSNKVFVFLHSWELLIPWWIYIIYTKKYPLGWAVTLAFAGHLLIDQFSYGAYPLTYFLTYRIFHHFELKRLFSY